MKVRYYWFLLVLIGLLHLSVSTPLWAAEVGSLISVDQVFKYAQSLEKEGDFNRAATEYGRLVFYLDHHPNHPFGQREVVYYRYAVALSKAGEVDKALQAFSNFGQHFPTSQRIAPALLRIGNIFEKGGMPEEAKKRYNYLISQNNRFSDIGRIRLAWLVMQEEGGVEQAQHQLAEVTDSNLIKNREAINRLLEDLNHLPSKDPWKAGLLTALLPGSGHLYLDRPKDGFFAFVSNGLLLAGTIQAFKQDISGLGIALGFVELGWYSGTIFSAVSLTHKYNLQIRHKQLDKMRPLLQPEPPYFGLELNLHY